MADLALTQQTDMALMAAQANRSMALGKNVTAEEARAKAQEFESVFLSQMMAPMFAELGNDPMFGGGEGEKMFRSMMMDEYGKIISRSGGIGVADAVMKTILDLQQVDGAKTPTNAQEAKL
ncbi:MAG: hypothetical protein A2516_08180 [Alphaproteobacteria bacterium RIFOXYD12_FULL_60_8]|nr:MAG: hypothetical protein A2516_08180 [Alphaproteobacteria bacterium RIFOXYD12_FULL_60_8]